MITLLEVPPSCTVNRPQNDVSRSGGATGNSTPRMAWTSCLHILCCGFLPQLVAGCVTVYQPLVGLQRPVAIQPQADNFKDLRLRVNCLPGGFVGPDEVDQLCKEVGRLFTGQGAAVETRTRLASDFAEYPSRSAATRADPRAAASPPSKPKPVDLEIDLTARQLHEDRNPLLFAISIATATLIPAISEYTFAQDVEVRDGDGFLLATDTWEARFVRYFGFTTWAVNGLLDLTLRKPADKLTGSAIERDFSHDFYAQLTQLVFNAKGRWTLLHLNEAPRNE
jgi:hypothetical protein